MSILSYKFSFPLKYMYILVTFLTLIKRSSGLKRPPTTLNLRSSTTVASLATSASMARKPTPLPGTPGKPRGLTRSHASPDVNRLARPTALSAAREKEARAKMEERRKKAAGGAMSSIKGFARSFSRFGGGGSRGGSPGPSAGTAAV